MNSVARRLRDLSIAAAALTLIACAPAPDDRYQGYLEANYAYVGAPQAGRLVELPVNRGSAVEIGTLLFMLDAELEKQQLAEAQARLAQTQAQRADLNQGRRPAEIQVIAGRIREARSVLNLAARELSRTTDLQKRGLVSNDALDRAAAAHSQAQARLASALAEQTSAELAGRPDTISAADAAVEAAQSIVEQTRWRLAQMQVSASAAARVDDTLFQVGEWVPAGAPVLKLLPTQGPFVRFFVPLTELAQWSPGVSIEVDCNGCAAPLTATVSFIAAAPEYTPPVIFSESRSEDLVYRVEAQFASAAPLAPGLPVTVRRL